MGNDGRMTNSEREQLFKLARLKIRNKRRDVDEEKAHQLAEVERQLASKYQADHVNWAEITAEAARVVEEASAKIAAKCKEMGVPEKFAPSLNLRWRDRGENAEGSRRVELRRVAQTELEARAKTAKVELDRVEERILTEITAAGLRSSEAMKFLDTMVPAIDKLMPKLELSTLQKKTPLLQGEGFYMRRYEEHNEDRSTAEVVVEEVEEMKREVEQEESS